MCMMQLAAVDPLFLLVLAFRWRVGPELLHFSPHFVRQTPNAMAGLEDLFRGNYDMLRRESEGREAVLRGSQRNEGLRRCCALGEVEVTIGSFDAMVPKSECDSR